jgi:uncharacterized protein involved in outer membrane biogenesis
LGPLRLARIALGVAAAVLVIAAVAALLIAQLDLRSAIERQGSRTLERRLTIGGLQVGWGLPLSIRLSDLRIANAPWGSKPEMMRIAKLSAEVDPWPLLRGVLQLRKIEAAGLRLLLERDPKGLGNWRFKAGSLPPIGHLAVIPKNRTQFPTLIDCRLRDGEVVLRNRRGGALTIGLQEVNIRSPNGDAPVSVAAAGSYNGRPARLTARTQSFAVLRDPTRPFGTAFSLATDGAKFDFNGTIMELLDFDGVDGTARLGARRISAVARFAGVELDATQPLRLTGAFKRNGDHWQLSRGTGKLATIDLAGGLSLLEGRRGAPDKLGADLDLGEVDLDRLLAGSAKSGAAGLSPIKLPQQPDPEIDARIRAKAVRYGAVRLTDPRAHGTLDGTGLRLQELRARFAGGSIDLAGSARPAGAGIALAARALFAAADLGRLAALLGARAGVIDGRLDGGVTVETTGATAKEALASSRGHAVLVMTQGRISRDLIERASTDLRSLFRKKEGATSVTCLLGVAEVRGGVASVSPLKLRSAEATLIGVGKLDLAGQRVDLTIKSDPETTGLLALDLPIRISGDFKKVSAEPVPGAPPIRRTSRSTEALLDRMSPHLRRLAEGSPCR